jgi:hypothetical protein
METLKSILNKDHSKKTKAELIDLLTGVEKIITPEVYEKINGRSPNELNDLNKNQIIDIVKTFSDKYDVKWENALASLSNETLKTVFTQMNIDEQNFKTAGVSSGEFAAEMGSIDFAKIIGGPLDACVKAQSNASVATVSFINEVAFETSETDPNDKKLRMADFNYTKKGPNPDYINEQETPGVSPTIDEEKKISIPFIAILNVPSFRIETCEIDFNVKLKSTYTSNINSEFGMKTNFSTGSGGLTSLFAKVSFNTEIAFKRTTSTGIKVEKEYSLSVRVKASNDEMPAGLEKVLGLLSA